MEGLGEPLEGSTTLGMTNPYFIRRALGTIAPLVQHGEVARSERELAVPVRVRHFEREPLSIEASTCASTPASGTR